MGGHGVESVREGERRPATPGERLLACTLLLVLLGGIALAVLGRRLPEAAGLDAPEYGFSAARARAELDHVARLPHPVGSGEHACVREQVRDSIVRLGLACEEQRGRVDGVPLTNLVARIPGCDPTGTVLCLAHYDSVPTGPGAGDDGAGVVVWLEVLRALRARGWQPRNDVLLLLSDGEELGLKGADLFATTQRAADDVNVVLNLEAIGNGGPAVLFELGPRNGARARHFARAVASPTGSSLADAVYRRMPNDTDLTVFLQRGIGGFNLALTSGSPAYHAPHDTPANLDPRSLQHMGECALSLLEHVAELDLGAELDGDDVTFFDLLGRGLVVHSRLFDPIPVLGGLGLVLLARRRAGLGWGESARLVRGHALAAGARAALLLVGLRLADGLAWFFAPGLPWVAGNTTSGAALFVGLVATMVALEARRADEQEVETERRTLGALGAWTLIALLALAVFRGASFVLAWPLVLAALGLLAWQSRSRLLAAPVLVLGLAATLLLALPILHLLVQLFQRRPTGLTFAAGFVLASAAALHAPHLRALRRGAPWAGGFLLALGLGACLASVFVARVLAWRQGGLLP